MARSAGAAGTGVVHVVPFEGLESEAQAAYPTQFASRAQDVSQERAGKHAAAQAECVLMLEHVVARSTGADGIGVVHTVLFEALESTAQAA